MKRAFLPTAAAIVAACWCFGLLAPAHCANPKAKRPAVVFRDDFTKLSWNEWSSPKGSPTVSGGRLVLISSPQRGAEVTSNREFTYKLLEVRAASSSWAPDTSLGFETWEGGHVAIVVNNGNLGILDKSRAEPNEWYKAIPHWDSIKSKDVVFRFVWQPKRVDLYVNGSLSVTYSGELAPGRGLKVRLNSSNDYNDRLKVDYVEVANAH